MNKLSIANVARSLVLDEVDSSEDTLDMARAEYEAAKADLDAAIANGKPASIGKAYIALTEADNAYKAALEQYTEDQMKADAAVVSFPKSDSKEEWLKKGLEAEYSFIGLWYKAADAILEAYRAADSIKDKMDKDDIKEYMSAYAHQLTNCNDMVRLGYINENSELISKSKANYRFVDAEARASEEAKEAREKAINEFSDILDTLLDTFIE